MQPNRSGPLGLILLFALAAAPITAAARDSEDRTHTCVEDAVDHVDSRSRDLELVSVSGDPAVDETDWILTTCHGAGQYSNGDACCESWTVSWGLGSWQFGHYTYSDSDCTAMA
jgi:hypothetical protein